MKLISIVAVGLELICCKTYYIADYYIHLNTYNFLFKPNYKYSELTYMYGNLFMLLDSFLLSYTVVIQLMINDQERKQESGVQIFSRKAII